MAIYNDYINSKTYESQIQRMYGDNPIHNEHIDEFRQMAATMIDNALRQHDQQVQVDVQTTLNGRPTTMRGLVDDVRKQVMDAMRKAFKK